MKFSTKTCIVAALAAAFTFSGPSAYAGRTWATEVTAAVCVPRAEVVAVEGSAEIAAVPAVEEVLAVEAKAAVPGFWQNFEPNKSKEPFVGPPSYPVDVRGTWSEPKTEGGPQQDAVGVYQNGQGNGSWFYRVQAVAAVEAVAYVAAVPAVEFQAAVVAVIGVPGVTCPPTTPPVVTPPTGGGEKPSTGTSSVSLPEKPEKPVVHKPKPPAPTDALPHTGGAEWLIALLGVALVGGGTYSVYRFRK